MNGSGPKIRLPTPTQIKQKYKTCLHKMTEMNQQRSLNFLSITATISRKREKKTKSLNFLYKPATMSITEEAKATILKAVLFHPDHQSPFNFVLNSTSKHISIFKTNISGFAKSRFLGNQS